MLFCVILTILIQLVLANDSNEKSKGLDFQNLSIKNLTDIRTLTSCKAQLDNGQLIDLSSLDNANNPRTSVFGAFTYKFNPCSSISCNGKQAAICQVYLDNKDFYVIGEQQTAQFQLLNGKVIIQYTSDAKRSKLQCQCADQEGFDFIQENPTNTYDLVFKSKCCCPDGCKAPPPPNTTTKKSSGPSKKGSLSFGSILLIIVLCTMTVYCIAGVLFMKYKRNATGVDMVPNAIFWKSIPGDVKNGFVFTVAKLKQSRGGYSKV